MSKKKSPNKLSTSVNSGIVVRRTARTGAMITATDPIERKNMRKKRLRKNSTLISVVILINCIEGQISSCFVCANNRTGSVSASFSFLK